VDAGQGLVTAGIRRKLKNDRKIPTNAKIRRITLLGPFITPCCRFSTCGKGYFMCGQGRVKLKFVCVNLHIRYT
jgi:hypothetical protein